MDRLGALLAAEQQPALAEAAALLDVAERHAALRDAQRALREDVVAVGGLALLEAGHDGAVLEAVPLLGRDHLDEAEQPPPPLVLAGDLALDAAHAVGRRALPHEARVEVGLRQLEQLAAVLGRAAHRRRRRRLAEQLVLAKVAVLPGAQHVERLRLAGRRAGWRAGRRAVGAGRRVALALHDDLAREKRVEALHVLARPHDQLAGRHVLLVEQPHQRDERAVRDARALAVALGAAEQDRAQRLVGLLLPPAVEDAAEVLLGDVALGVGVEGGEGAPQQLGVEHLGAHRPLLPQPVRALARRLGPLVVPRRHLLLQDGREDGGAQAGRQLGRRRHGATHAGAAARDDPRVLEQLLDREPLRRVLGEQPLDEVLRLPRDLVPARRREVGRLRLDAVRRLLGVGLALGVEGVVAAQRDEEHHAERPHVRRQPHPAVLDRLGRPVRPRAAPVLRDVVVALRVARQPKVDEPHLPVLGEQQVLGLDVRVAHALRVQQRQRAAHLLEHGRRLGLRVRADLDDVVEQLASVDKLHHNVEARRRLVEVVDLTDRAVQRDASQRLHLGADHLLGVLAPAERLDRDRPTRLLASAFVDATIRARAELASELVVVVDLARLARGGSAAAVGQRGGAACGGRSTDGTAERGMLP